MEGNGQRKTTKEWKEGKVKYERMYVQNGGRKNEFIDTDER